MSYQSQEQYRQNVYQQSLSNNPNNQPPVNGYGYTPTPYGTQPQQPQQPQQYQAPPQYVPQQPPQYTAYAQPQPYPQGPVVPAQPYYAPQPTSTSPAYRPGVYAQPGQPVISTEGGTVHCIRCAEPYLMPPGATSWRCKRCKKMNGYGSTGFILCSIM